VPSLPRAGPVVRTIAISCFALLTGCAAAADSNALPSCTTPLNARVENSCVVTPQALWRGAKPDDVAAATLVEMGAKTVVNLELLYDDRQSFDGAKVSVGARREVQYFRIADWEPLVVFAPQKVDDHVAHFIAITRTQPLPVFVHCRSGRNRTGVMVAAYRVFNGMSNEDAIAEMKRYGGEWFKYDADYIRSLTPQRREELERRVREWIPKLRPDARIVCMDGSCKTVSN
jgi:protein tyrosine phosphatase (PTP) superfamily phosphohydrolase (DUF442 family)